MHPSLSNTRCVILANPDHPKGYALKVIPVSPGDTVQGFGEAGIRAGFTVGFAMDRMVTPQEVARYIPGIAKMPGVQFVLDLRNLSK